MCTVGSAGSMQFVLVSFRLSAGKLPSLHGRALRQLHGLAGFAGEDAHRVSVQASCPLLCSTDARYRRAENCGAPQLQFVDQSSRLCLATGTRTHSATVQSSAAKSGGLAHRCRAGGGHVHRDVGASRGRIWTDTYVKHTVRTTTTTTVVCLIVIVWVVLCLWLRMVI